MKERQLGVLLPLFSLPGKQGIGSFGEMAYRWIDTLHCLGFAYWQICPLGPTAYGNSPYQPLSEIALNGWFVDWQYAVQRGWLDVDDLKVFDGLPNDYVCYEKIAVAHKKLLSKASSKFFNLKSLDADYEAFCKREKDWLDVYVSFCALREHFDEKPWWEWPQEFRSYESDAVKAYVKKHDVRQHYFVQWLAFKQWEALRQYANKKGVQIIGDIPIYVGEDSAIVWAQRSLFQWDYDNDRPQKVAGVPPDYFSADGQLWGNPLYDWNFAKKTHYAWWLHRVQKNLELVDIVRLDHFRAFYDYWSIKFGATTAREGTWEKGPQKSFFDALEQHFPKMPFILEDLGDLHEKVRAFQKKLKLPGMSVLQFAFDREDNMYLPDHWSKRTVVYTGTHDNDTIKSWFDNESRFIRQACINYLTRHGICVDTSNIARGIIELIIGCLKKDQKAIIPLQDWLNFGGEARINTPGTVGDNWSWRCSEDDFSTLIEVVKSIMAKF